MAIRTISGSFTIGQSQTSALLCGEWDLVGLSISASTITGTTITFLTSYDGVTYLPLYDETGTEQTLTVGAYARNYTLQPYTFFPWNYVKLRLGTSASPVNQATYNTDVKFILRSM